ncbi:MAG: T9SS type A sorting domain-containing protein [Bacteroidales bacterium]|nr:T9SS type A sorting domain-containing protein [Bacteroidales bacterium]
MYKKYVVLLFSLLGFHVVFGQQKFSVFETPYCSHARFYESYHSKAVDIDQSPLLFKYDVKFYYLDLNIENNTTSIEGSVKILAKAIVSSLDTFAIELIDEMIIDSLKINEQNHSFYRANDEVFVPLIESLPQNSLFAVLIYYHGEPPAGGFFSGVNMAYDSTWNKSVVWTLSEPFNARQWWPVKQDLSDKADSVWVFITTSNENLAGSIGILKNVVSLPNNKTRFEWKSRYPIAYYLISFAVADYQEYNLYAKPVQLNGDSILIQNFIYDSPGCLNIHKEGIDRTVQLVELFSDLYSLYPFYEEKYGHCLTMLSGGMEHQTMTTIGGFGLGLVAHELSHMWFGDNVTCATWSDIWVNEGFATYSDYLAHEIIAGEHWPAKWMNEVHAYVISEPGGSVYVPPEEVSYDNILRIFSSRLSYYKGALILHMIRYELDDDDLFFQVFKNFQESFKDSVATGQDFVDVLNYTTGKDFNPFFDQWFYGEGYPIYTLDYSINEGILEIHSTQSASMPEITPFFEMKYPLTIYFNDATDTTIQISQTQSLIIRTVNIIKGVDSISLDPDNWVVKKVESINKICEKHSQFEIKIAPIPAKDFIILSVDTGPEQYRASILDIFGNTRLTQELSVGENIIKLKHLPSGVYFILIDTAEGKQIKKFIKR